MKKTNRMDLEYKVVFFDTQAKWSKWLAANHAKTKGVYLRMYKKESVVKSLTYPEALDSALCYGWIDGIKRKYDDRSWVQKFTLRGSKSTWSKINIGHVDRLNKAGKMKPAGLAAVAAAKADGRWERAYSSASQSNIPNDFLKEIKKDKIAYEFFKTLNKANRYAITWRLETAKKPETRQNRMRAIILQLHKLQKFH